MIVVIALSIMIFTATASVLSGLRSAPSTFVSGQGFVLMSTTAPTIFSSHVESSMVATLEGVPNVTGVSPEVFALASWDGVSFVLRGVVLEKLNSTGPAFRHLDIVQGESIGDRTSALVGERLLGRLGIDLPYVLPITGSYSSKMEFLRAIGSFETGSSMDDEMIVSMDAARFLSGMPSSKVSVIRIATSEPQWLSDILSPSGPRFTLFDLHTLRSSVASGEEVTFSVGVRNWGTSPGSVRVTFLEGSQILSQIDSTLNASEVARVQHNFSSSSLGLHTINVSISGDFPVTLSTNVTVVGPYLELSCPARVPSGSWFNATTISYLGRPVEGASVTFRNQTVWTNEHGNASMWADTIGSFQILASKTGLEDGTATITVFDPSSYPSEFIPSIIGFTLAPDSIKESQSTYGMVVVENAGTLGGSLNLTVMVDSSPQRVIQVDLSGLESRSVSFTLRDIRVGTHFVQVGSFSQVLNVQSWIVDNPDLVQLAIRYSGSSELLSPGSIPIYQAAKISEGNVEVALVALGGISALLAALAIVSVFSKEVREGRRRLGVLRTIGATNTAIRRLIFPQALRAGLMGSAVGVALGLAASELVSRSGVLYLFGHELNIVLDAGLVAMILVVAVVLSVMSALASALMANRETAIASIRRLPEPPGEPLDVDAFLGEE